MAADGFQPHERPQAIRRGGRAGPGRRRERDGRHKPGGSPTTCPFWCCPAAPAWSAPPSGPTSRPSRPTNPSPSTARVITRPDMVGAVMRRAFHALRNGRPGPVVVEMPADVCDQQVPEESTPYHSPRRLRAVAGRVGREGRRRRAARLGPPRHLGRHGCAARRGHRGVARVRGANRDSSLHHRCPASPPSTNATRSPWAEAAAPQPAPPGQWLQEADTLFAIGSSMTRTGYGQPIPPRQDHHSQRRQH